MMLIMESMLTGTFLTHWHFLYFDNQTDSLWKLEATKSVMYHSVIINGIILSLHVTMNHSYTTSAIKTYLYYEAYPECHGENH